METGTIRNRREFLRRARNVTLTTPPTLAVLLVADRHNYAMALSGGSVPTGQAGFVESLFTLSADEDLRGLALEKSNPAGSALYAEGASDITEARNIFDLTSEMDAFDGSPVPNPGFGNP
jgi:hypothetical protein